MRIYVSHSKKFDYKKELYEPLRKSNLNKKHEIILPHEKSDKPFSSKEFFKTIDAMISEVSYSSTGLGIELGWADASNVPLFCIYKKGSKISSSLKVMRPYLLEYSNDEELISGIEKKLKGFELLDS